MVKIEYQENSPTEEGWYILAPRPMNKLDPKMVRVWKDGDYFYTTDPVKDSYCSPSKTSLIVNVDSLCAAWIWSVPILWDKWGLREKYEE